MTGAVIPLRVNPAPETAICEISMMVVPPLVSVTFSVWLLPIVTLPKDSVGGLSPSCPAAAVVVPDPFREILAVAFEASLLTVAVASNAPVAFGANVMPMDVFCPAARVTGRVGEVSRKFWLLIATLVIVMDELPELVAVNVVPLVLPTATLPKLTVVLPKERVLVSTLFGGGVC